MASVSIDAMRPEIWRKALFADAMAGLFFATSGMMGSDDNNIIQTMDDLKKTPGDTITFGLTTKLAGAGIGGDSTLEGSEDTITAYSESVLIGQQRNGVLLTGNLDEKKNAYNMRTDAKNKLEMWVKEFVERQIFLKMGGVTNASLTDIAGTTVGANCAWANTPDFIANADTTAGVGVRYVCANSNGVESLGAGDKMSPKLISIAKVKAQTASPKILPLRVNGKNYYVMFIHPWQAFDLKQDSVWMGAQKDAQVRGDQNPLFTGALGIWDGVIIYEHEYVPYLDISAAGYSFRGTATGSVYGYDAARALLCGRQAIGFAQCDNPKGWVEKEFDYENQIGFATGIIGGIQKLMFNSKEYGVIAIDTAATTPAL